MATTDRDYADKGWLAEEHEPHSWADVGYVILGAACIAILITVALHLQ